MARRIGLNWLVGLALANGCASEDDDDATTVATTPGGTDDGATAPADDGDDDGVDDGADDGPATADDGPSTSPPDTGADDDPPVTSGPVDSGDEGPADDGDTGAQTDAGEDVPEETGDGGPLQMCLDMAETDCEDCACMNCLAEVQACQADPGCVEIRMCAQENMCTGIECLGPCGAVIDENGGPFGGSAGLASTLSDCYEGACPNC